MTVVAYLQDNTAALLIATALLGLIMGSFLNVVIYRLPLMMEQEWRSQCVELLGSVGETPASADRFNLLVPRSRCPHCGHHISALENIPILSYLLLRGKCSACGSAISPRYPAIEFLSAALSVIVAWQFGFGWPLAGALLLTWTLIALSFIDFDKQLLPDSITLPVLWLGIGLSLFGYFTDTASSVIGAMAGYLVLWAVYHLFRLLTGKEGMGHGDFKLLALLGAWMGWKMLPLIVLLSSAVGAIIGVALILLRGQDKNVPIPFGPYLAIAGWLGLLWGEELVNVYLSWIGV